MCWEHTVLSISDTWSFASLPRRLFNQLACKCNLDEIALLLIILTFCSQYGCKKKKEYIMSVIYTIHKCGVVMEDMLLWGDIIINIDDLSHLDLMYFYNMSPHLSHSLFNYQYKKRTVSCNSHWAPIDVLHLHIVDWNALWFSIVQIFQQYLFHPKNFDMDHSSWFSLSVSN